MSAGTDAQEMPRGWSPDKTWGVSQLGHCDGSWYATREEAQSEADRLNAEADEECDEEVVGDGAASVVEVRP